MIHVDSKTRPQTTTIKPDSMHTAGVELDMARATQTLWYRNGGNRHSYYWLSPSEAPKCAITAYDTYTSFLSTNSYDSATCEIPWMCQTGVTTISISAMFATSYAAPIACRAATNGLIAASTETFTADGYSQSNVASVPAGTWALIRNYKTFELNVDTAPDIPANRLIKIYFSAKASSFVNNWWDLDGATLDPLLINIYLIALFVQDKMYEVY